MVLGVAGAIQLMEIVLLEEENVMSPHHVGKWGEIVQERV